MENLIIRNPKEDSYGNVKENIFIAFDHNENYLGSGYIYPNLNYDMSPEHPMNIYLDINMANQDDFGNEVCCELLNKLKVRAKEIRELNKDITARLYFGCISGDRTKFDFFVSKGFVHDEATYLLEVKINDYVIGNEYIENVEIRENTFVNESEKEKLIKFHNDIFIKTIDYDFISELNEHEITKHYTAYQNNEMIGHIMIYADKTQNGKFVGKIENLFVINGWRKKKIARRLMDEVMKYFKNNCIEHVQLEVWSANKVAYAFYEKIGFKFIKETELYTGIYL